MKCVLRSIRPATLRIRPLVCALIAATLIIPTFARAEDLLVLPEAHPPPVPHWDITIDTTITATVKLDEVATETGRIHVTDTGKVDIPHAHVFNVDDCHAIFGRNPKAWILIDEMGIVNTNQAFGHAVFLESSIVENRGTISSDRSSAVRLTGTSQVWNQVWNSGTIKKMSPFDSTQAALDVDGGGLTNTGIISAKSGTAVRFGTGTVDNRGTIEGGTNGSAGHGVDMGNGTLENTGSITGKNSGARIVGSAADYAEITNAGKGVISGITEDGVSVDYGNIRNLGNDARITSADGNGIRIGHSGTVENEGTITGGERGITCHGQCSVVNSGTIKGRTGVGFRDQRGGDNFLDNSGVITGTGGTAVDMGGGDDTLIARRNAVFNGFVNGNDGDDTLLFDDAGKRLSSQFVDFERLSFIGGTTTLAGDWEFSGGSTTMGGDGTNMILDAGSSLKTATFEVSGNGGIVNRGLLVSGAGPRFLGDNANVLDNSGTVIGNDGTAVDMGAGDDTVYARSGSIFWGDVEGNTGTDTIRFDGNVRIVGGTIRDFERIVWSGSGSHVFIDGDVRSGKEFHLYSNGVFEVGGTYTQEKGSSLFVRFVDGVAGRILARTGRIDGGIVLTEGYVKEGRHVLIETKEGLTGTFEGLRTGEEQSLGRYLKFTMGYDDRSASIQSSLDMNIRRVRLFADDALTRNERAVATCLDGLYNRASGDLVSVFDELMKNSDDATARSAFNQMAGASHTVYPLLDAQRQSLLFQTLFPRNSLPAQETAQAALFGQSRLQLAMNGNGLSDFAAGASSLGKAGLTLSPGFWIRGFGAFVRGNEIDIASRYDSVIAGAMAGMDFSVTANLRAGAALGYAKTTMTGRDLPDSGKEDSIQIALYGSYTTGKWYADAALAYSDNSYETSRAIAFGNLSRAASGSYGGYDVSGFAEGGYRASLWGFDLVPLASVLAIRHHRDAFTETQADSLNLEAETGDVNFLKGYLGVRLARTFLPSETFSLIPEFSVRWVHEFGNEETTLNARFAGAPFGSSFTVYSDVMERDSGLFSLGLTGKTNDNWSFYLAYNCELNVQQITHAASAGVRVNW
jgi:uncharacterized protein with beta-barrel porin domain